MNMLFERLREINAKRSINDIEINWGAEQDPDEGLEVDNIGVSEAIPCPEIESPNDLDPDFDVLDEQVNPTVEAEQEFKNNLLCDEEPLCNVNFVHPEEALTTIVENLPHKVTQDLPLNILPEQGEYSEERIKEFYRDSPELKGRLYPNGSLNPVLTRRDYEWDQLWVKIIRGKVTVHPRVLKILQAHDILFSNALETKNSEWNKETASFMNKCAQEILKNINEGDPEFPYSEGEIEEIAKDFQRMENEIKTPLPTTEEKEESMDVLCSDPYRKEDTSGNTKSNVYSFLEKYAEGNDAIQILRRDLMSVTSDMHWIRESKNQHEQWALDFADALNELSVSI